MRISPILSSVAIISTAVAVRISTGAYKNISSILNAAQTSGSDKDSRPKVVDIHNPGYPINTISGSILDPPLKQQMTEIPSMPSSIV